MKRNALAEIATLNKKLVDDKKVNIPKTIQINYDATSLAKSKIYGNTAVHFETMKTDECAIYYLEHKNSKSVTVMNFASRHSHGGGYRKGALAQEEDLCRVMPGLYTSLTQIKYPFPADAVLITPNVQILRDNKKYKLLPANRVVSVGVVSAAAQNLRLEDFDEQLVRRILMNMYCAVKKCLPATDTFILGAWGCGAYGNNAVVMARIMNEINLEFGGYFKTIVFSVPEGVNTNEFRDNITTFA